jgi:hypothetical protein
LIALGRPNTPIPPSSAGTAITATYWPLPSVPRMRETTIEVANDIENAKSFVEKTAVTRFAKVPPW